MLAESQLYTLIEEERKFSLYFLEGQKLIHDLVLVHDLQQGGFDYFRPAVLSVQLMLGLLKRGEYFCFYIDSEAPYFRLKIEMNHLGVMRGMLYPNHLDVAPQTITGQVRLVKFLPHSESPYQSTLQLQNVSIHDIINLVLSQSYQVKSQVLISEKSDQGFMLHQLPLMPKEEPANLAEAFNKYMLPLQALMAAGHTSQEVLQKELAQLGFQYLAGKQVCFKCGCSKEQMVENVKKLANVGTEAFFAPDEEQVDVICEYCKTTYPITPQDIEHSSAPN